MRQLTMIACAAGTVLLAACQSQKDKPAEVAEVTPIENVVQPIPQTDATVLVLAAHPHMDKSHANAALAKAAAEVKGVQVVNVYDYPVTPEFYREVVTRAKGIVYQFPVYWMSAPHLLKQWTDEVFMPFTQGESLVKGKKFMVCCTTGSPEEAYQHGGRNKYTIEEYLRPYEGQANHAEMVWEQPLPVYGQAPNAGQAQLQKGCQVYKERLQQMVSESAEE